jgi:hypothetical protein
VRTPGEDMDLAAAYATLSDAGLAPPHLGRNAIRDALRNNVVDGAVGGVPVHLLDNDERRREAYQALEAAGMVAPLVTEEDMRAAVGEYVFFDAYLEPDPAVTAAARASLDSTRTAISMWQFLSISLDAVSLASIFFLAAIGLAITFGVMRVINMAHGEFIMMGAYTGYVVQTVIPELHHIAGGGAAFGLCGYIRGRGRDGALGHPPSLHPPAGNTAGHLRHIHRAATTGQEHLWHAGPPPDSARLAGRGDSGE